MLTNTVLILDDLSFLHQMTKSFRAYVNASRGGGGGGGGREQINTTWLLRELVQHELEGVGCVN